jgi:hypothetical protein
MQMAIGVLFIIGNLFAASGETCTTIDAITSATKAMQVSATSQACEITASIVWIERHGDGTGYMEYGTSTGYGTKIDISGKTGTISLTGLTRATTYYFHFHMSKPGEPACTTLVGSFKTNGGTPANQPPQITSAAAVSCTTGTTKTYTITATDPNNDPITFSVGNLPAWGTFASPVLTMKPKPASVKEIVVVIASDGNGGLDTLNLAITIVQNTTSVFSNSLIPRQSIFKLGTAQIAMQFTGEKSLMVSVYSSNGARVFHRAISLKPDNSIEAIPLNELKTGIYLLKVESMSTKWSKEIFIGK